MLAATFGNSWRLPDSEVILQPSGSLGSLPCSPVGPPLLASVTSSSLCCLSSSLAFSLGPGLALSQILGPGKALSPVEFKVLPMALG